MVTEKEIKNLINDMSNYDPDRRFMAARDLTRLVTEHEARTVSRTEFGDDTSRISLSLQTQIFEAFLQQMGGVSVEVQGNAVRCIGETLGTFPQSKTSIEVLTGLAQGMINKPKETRDIYTTCLKSLPSRLPYTMAEAYCRGVVPIALTGLSKTPADDSRDACLLTVAIWEDCCDVLCGALQKYSSASQWSQHHTPLLSKLFTLLQKQDQPTVQKRAVRTIGAVATSLPRHEVGTLVKSLLVAAQLGGMSVPVLTDSAPNKESRVGGDGKVDAHMVRIYVQCLANVARTVEWSVVRHLVDTVTIIFDAVGRALNWSRSLASTSHTEDIDDFAELCLTSIAALFSSCPREMAMCLNELINQNLLFTLMCYDRDSLNGDQKLSEENLASINIDNQLEDDTVCTGDGTDSAQADFEFEDGDDAEFNFEGVDVYTGLHSADTSWKVRRAALSVAVSIIRACARGDLRADYLVIICGALWRRCHMEPDNSVKLTLFSAIDELVFACKDTSSIRSHPHSFTTSVLGVRDSAPWILGALRILLQQGVPHRTEAGAFVTLNNLCAAFPSATVERVAKLTAEMQKSLQSDPFVQPAVMNLIRQILISVDETMNFDIIRFTRSLLPLVTALCQDPNSNIAEQAFLTVTEFLNILAKKVALMELNKNSTASIEALLQPAHHVLLDFSDRVVGSYLTTPANIQSHAVVTASLQAYGSMCIAANELKCLRKAALQYRSSLIPCLTNELSKQRALAVVKNIAVGVKWKDFFTTPDNSSDPCIAEILNMIIQQLQWSVYTTSTGTVAGDSYVLLFDASRHLLSQQPQLLIDSKIDAPSLLSVLVARLTPRDFVVCNAAFDLICMIERTVSTCELPDSAAVYNVLINKCLPKVVNLCKSPVCTAPTLKRAHRLLLQIADSPTDLASTTLSLLNSSNEETSTEIDNSSSGRGANGTMNQDEGSHQEKTSRMKLIISALLTNAAAYTAVHDWCWQSLSSAALGYKQSSSAVNDSFVDLVLAVTGTLPVVSNLSEERQFNEIDFYKVITEILQYLPNESSTMQFAAEALSCLVVSHVETLLPHLTNSLKGVAIGTRTGLFLTVRQVFERLHHVATVGDNVAPDFGMCTGGVTSTLSSPKGGLSDAGVVIVNSSIDMLVEATMAAAADAEPHVLGDCLGSFLVFNWTSSKESLHELTQNSAKSRIAALNAMKYFMLNKQYTQESDAERLEYLRAKFLVCIGDESIEVRKLAWRCVASLSTAVDSICLPFDLNSRARIDLKVDRAHIRDVVLGPMVIQEDDGLPLRKAVFQAYTALVKGSRVDYDVCFQLAQMGLEDVADLRLLSCQMVVELVNSASSLDLVLPELNEFGRAIDIALKASREASNTKSAAAQGAADFIRSGTSCLMSITKRIVSAVFPGGRRTVNSETLEILSESVFGRECAEFLETAAPWIQDFFSV